MNNTETNRFILIEAITAYCDDSNFCLSTDERNLDFRASYFVNRDVAMQIFHAALSHGYNEFNYTLLKHLPEDSEITIAREGSVCIYVKSDTLLNEYNSKSAPKDYFNALSSLRRKLKADELSLEADGEFRIWWD